MIFKRATQRYGRTPQPETPYQRAGQLWDERIGSARVQARNWRLMAFGCLSLAAGMSGALIWQSLQSRVVPYVVAVDRLGEARAVSEAEIAYQPTDPQIAWHLSRFITNIRSVSLDPVLMRRAWLEAYDFVTRRGATFLGDYARSADPFAQVGDRTVSVQVTSVVRASDKSFQVKWMETIFERGAEAGSSRWTAIMTVANKPPATAEILRKNPLGIYVDAVDWSKELDAPAPPAPRPSPSTGAIDGSPASPAVADPVDPSPSNIQEVQP
jgi:type IV secretory pathway TrbF-like protein